MMLALAGCGENAAAVPDSMAAKPFDIEGAWTYLGPSDGPHDLTITRTSMVYTDVDMKWASKWTVKAYDNDLHQFQVTFESGSGTYLPMGQSMSGSYELSGSTLTTQLANGASYPTLQFAGACTDSNGTPVLECRLYIKKR
jgi:hypothetical protein